MRKRLAGTLQRSNASGPECFFLWAQTEALPVSSERAPGEEFARRREEISSDGRSKLGAEQEVAHLQHWWYKSVCIIASFTGSTYTQWVSGSEVTVHLALCLQPAAKNIYRFITNAQSLLLKVSFRFCLLNLILPLVFCRLRFFSLCSCFYIWGSNCQIKCKKCLNHI